MSGGFRAVHPAVALMYYGGLLLFAAVLFHPLFLLTQIAALLVLLLMQGQGRSLRRTLPFYLLMAGGVAVLNPLFSHRGASILFYFLDQPITLESVLYGLMMMLVLLSIFIVFLSYNHTVTTDKFMYLFAAAAPKSALLTLMAIRFVPLFQRRLRQIGMVQSTRGIDVTSGSVRKRIKDGLTLLKVLLTWSLEEALQSADSMKARGYGIRKRSSYAIYKLDRQDIVLLVLLAASGAAVVFGWLQGYGVLEIYPRLRPHDFSLEEGAMYGCFGLFVLLPLALEAKEKWIWRSSRSTAYPSGIPKKTGPHWMSSRSR
ncbi:energy-coupling factor transporter transmembrane component T [Paenibacillus donghaensis]|uniref:Uncharacterized protein n=1 Tax=Paenibacillus donghaensis TaxID=414771 RepID=A0A2Z2KQ98_9BACL|nr:energy-coupling factor transporter transmembrane component T [Paenibacillus donghaensis]ASA25970.1 hypothetical protein B9T62_37815 [Paenibacillus donghaensis]